MDVLVLLRWIAGGLLVWWVTKSMSAPPTATEVYILQLVTPGLMAACVALGTYCWRQLTQKIHDLDACVDRRFEEMTRRLDERERRATLGHERLATLIEGQRRIDERMDEMRDDVNRLHGENVQRFLTIEQLLRPPSHRP